VTIVFTKPSTTAGRVRFEARIEGAEWDAPRVIIEQTFGLSKHGPAKGQRLGPADSWTLTAQVRGKNTLIGQGNGDRAAAKAYATAWLEQHAEQLGGVRDQARALVQVASLFGGLGGLSDAPRGLRVGPRRSTGEHQLLLRGRVAGVDPATGAVDLEVDGRDDMISAMPRAHDRELQRQAQGLRVGQAVVLEAATTDEPPSAARRVTLLRIRGSRE